MDAASQVSYSFVDKYFKVMPEGRIRRYQFFVRSLFFGVITGIISSLLFTFVLKGLLGFEAIIYGTMILSGLYYVVSYFAMIPLIKKRCRDIGRNGKTESILYTISVIINLIVIIGLFGLEVPGYGLFYLFSNYTGFIILVIVLALLIQKGSIGDNDYGKDPMNTKVSFLG